MKRSTLLLAMSCAALISPAHAVVGDSVAEIVSVQGVGQYRPQNASQWNAASVRLGLLPGYFVRTGDLSRMAILFRDETQVRLNQNSQLQIKAVGGSGKADDTVLRLNAGRSWSQTKNVPRSLTMETPAATAAIRGTDWELEVDEATGRSTLTVLSGSVEFFNEQGNVTVNRNEQSVAEPGKAPVKTILVNPRARVQWVSAYAIDPLRQIGPADLPAPAAESADAAALTGLGYAELRAGRPQEAERLFDRAERAGKADAERLALGRAASLILQERLKPAEDILAALAVSAGLTLPAADLLLSDLLIVRGEFERALDHAQRALSRFPGDPRVHAQLARLHLLMDAPEQSEAAARQAIARGPSAVEGRLALGDWARWQGNARAAEAAYAEAAALKPQEDRAWFGLGSIASEREDVRLGRERLGRAIELNPRGPGYRGELGTLETFANAFPRAEEEYRQALEQNPGDFVALTGLGYLKLKRGETEAALEDFLRAGVMEPRYARAHVFTAIAYYQLGRSARALEELGRAKELDRNDPLPYLLAGMIHTDHFEASQAIAEGRRAMQLMPYLKSLNQLANNQKGSANLGGSLAFFGMEEWAEQYAHESYYPYWAGSHLFLADRYNGLYNKNSELMQGFLADPTVFGASNRFQTLVPKPAHYATLGLRLEEDSRRQFAWQPYAILNGFGNSLFPAAYFLDVEKSRVDPPKEAGEGFSGDAKSFTAALGALPTHELGLFLYANKNDTSALYTNPATATFNSPMNLRKDRADAGLHYKFGPESQLWLKAGSGHSRQTTEAYGVSQYGLVLYGVSFDTADAVGDRDNQDLQFRHTFSIGAGEITWGLETARQNAASTLGVYPASTPALRILADTRLEEKSLDAYVSARMGLSERFTVQGDLFLQRYDNHSVNQAALLDVPMYSVDQSLHQSKLNARLGAVFKLAPAALARFAYQEWNRPAATSTLSPVDTAGIPLEDRLANPGGFTRRLRLQGEWEWSGATFAQAYLDRQYVDNMAVSTNALVQAPNVEDLVRLRNTQIFNTAMMDPLEDIPDIGHGRVLTAGAALNQVLDRNWSLYSRYIQRATRNSASGFEDNQVAYMPRHYFAVGATWVNGRRYYVSGALAYRSSRYADKENLVPLRAGWSGALLASWETLDKHWALDGYMNNLFNKDFPKLFGVNARYRF